MAASKPRLTAEPERVNPVTPIHLWRSPAGADTEVIVTAQIDVYAAIDDHARAALPNETGGFLLGHVGWDSAAQTWLVQIDEVVETEPLSQTPTHFSFSWRDVDRVRARRELRGKALVGWYHTHPDMDIFLSETDLEKTHQRLFSEPFQVALVYDPVRGRAGYFFWEGPQKIDASQAPWREFQIAADDGPSREGIDTEPVEIVANGRRDPADTVPSVTPGSAEVSLASQFLAAARSATAAVSLDRGMPEAPQSIEAATFLPDAPNLERAAGDSDLGGRLLSTDSAGSPDHSADSSTPGSGHTKPSASGWPGGS